MTARLVATVWLASTLWLLTLSTALGVAPGAAIVVRNNVVFQVDVASHYRELTGAPDPFAPRKPRISAPHPLLPQIWGTLGGAVAAALRSFLPRDLAQLTAARLVVASVAAMGIAALAWFACVEGVPLMWTLLVLAMTWLASATVIVALPNHFGLSFGLMLVAFVGAWSAVTRRQRGWWVWSAGALAVATTVTNGVLMIALVAWMALARRRSGGAADGPVGGLRRWTVVALVVLAVGSGALIVPRAVSRIRTGETIATRYLHLQLVREPGRSLLALPLSLSYPVVAGRPHIAGPPGDDGLSLEPWRADDLPLSGLVGTLAWLVLLAFLTKSAWRPGPPSQAVSLLAGWVVFNWGFHSVWGDERFLYTPHWSWTFPLLGLLAARAVGRVRFWWVTLAVVVLAAEALAMTTIVTLARTTWR